MSGDSMPAVAPAQMSMATSIITHGGRVLDLLTPRPEAIDLHDIAISLSRLPRFNGHLRGAFAYSVAQHSLAVAGLLPLGSDVKLRLAALLHDAHEAYVGDITRPMRTAVRLVHGAANDAIEDWIVQPIQRAIHEHFGLPSELPAEWREVIRLADDQALRAEAEALLVPPSAVGVANHPAWSWLQALPAPPKAQPGVRLPQSSDEAEWAFINAVRYITGERRP